MGRFLGFPGDLEYVSLSLRRSVHMPKRVSLGFLFSLAVVGSAVGGLPALAQVAVDTPAAGTTSIATVVPGVGANLAIIEQLLASAGRGSASVNTNIGRLNASGSTSTGGAGS